MRKKLILVSQVSVFWICSSQAFSGIQWLIFFFPFHFPLPGSGCVHLLEQNGKVIIIHYINIFNLKAKRIDFTLICYFSMTAKWMDVGMGIFSLIYWCHDWLFYLLKRKVYKLVRPMHHKQHDVVVFQL